MKLRSERRYAGELPLGAAQTARRSEAVRVALAAIPDAAAALSFLNAHDAQLGGRPLDLATDSAAGLVDVVEALKRHSATLAGAAS